MRRGQLGLAWVVDDLAEIAAQGVQEGSQNGGMDLGESPDLVEDTNLGVVVHRKAFQGMEGQVVRHGPNQLVVVGKMEEGIEDDGRKEDHLAVQDLGRLEVGLVGDLAPGVSDVADFVLELVPESAVAIHSVECQLAKFRAL